MFRFKLHLISMPTVAAPLRCRGEPRADTFQFTAHLGKLNFELVNARREFLSRLSAHLTPQRGLQQPGPASPRCAVARHDTPQSR